MSSVQNGVQNLDLSVIRQSLMRKLSWSESQAEAAEAAYRQFLLQASEQSASPDPTVDVFWHEHILHTKKYAEDCAAAIGHFLHHEPSLTDNTCGSGGGCKSKVAH